MRHFSAHQSGRSMLEMLVVIVLIAIIGIAGYWLFSKASDKAKARAVEQDIDMRVAQLRHQALTSRGIQVETEAAAQSRSLKSASGILIQTIETDDSTFTLRVGSNGAPFDRGVCQILMKSTSFSPNNNNGCKNGYAEFVFPKFESLKKY